MLKLCLLLVVVFLHRALVHADYTIDDSNYSVLKFSENPSGPVWGPFGSDTGEVLEIRLPNGTMQTVDATQCYDGTYTYAACSTSNNCAVQFSFTGSGITIYVLQAGPQGMSASLSIDSGTATTATLGAPPSPQYYIPHVTLFDVQNIPSGTHSAIMTVLDWNGGFSGMMLDYINVNQAQVAGPSTSSTPAASPSPSPSPSPGSTAPNSNPSQSSSLSGSSAGTQTSFTGTQTVPGIASIASVVSVFSHSSGVTALPSSTASGNGTISSTSSSSTSNKTQVAAIVGGVVGGAGLLAVLGLTFFCCRRRRRRQHLQALNERPNPLFLPQPEPRFTSYDAINVDPFNSSAALPASRPSETSRPLQSWSGSEVGSAPNLAARDQSSSIPLTNHSHARFPSSGDDSATSFMPVSIGVASVATPQDRDASTPYQLARIDPAQVSYPNEKSWAAPGQAPTLPGDSSASPDASSTRPNASLTDEQADFVNSLFNNNIPAPVVARVIERMVTNPQGTNSVGINDPELRAHIDPGSLLPSSQTQPPTGGMRWLPTMSDIGDGETTVGTAPPSYDYARAQ